ncbi:PREDICTED: uncharacterized protein LOC107355667 [Acropora digitifera]|uniref:uncharacterized protein LOC107355667 n=1 Tax=Acropora digitifera TaxID=70779 RepID=UPI00077A150B|nr:PREDICTED: uncharacterized protein LOC107355667 [Acropora digitifera]
MALFLIQSDFCRISFCLSLLFTSAFGEILPSLLWHYDNPIFDLLGNSTRNVMLDDRWFILCPTIFDYPVKRDSEYSRERNLKENLYIVDKTGFDTCNATLGHKILSCSNALTMLYSALVFQESSASSKPSFKRGREYYFINTADGTENSLGNLVGGRCAAGKMKMKIYVCKGANDPRCNKGNNVVNGAWSDWSQCTDGIQTRQCNNPSQANGGVSCVGISIRDCTTAPSQTKRCSESSFNSRKITTVDEETTLQGIPAGGRRTGDESNEDELRMGKGLLIGLCFSLLVFGLVLGGLLAWLISRFHRRKLEPNNKGSSVDDVSRPYSSYSTASEMTSLDA